MAKTFSIYRSSAGSGKTRTLAKEYLKLALKFKADYFKYILAVTFTNKASQEMKDRILSYLDDFAKGKNNELAIEIRTELGYDDQTFQQHCQEVQSAILHQYSQFAISTIDAFFQKVIRSFTRESGLVGDYRLEVEHDDVLEEVINNLIDELGSNKELTDWVVEFARENLENERAWDVRFSLIEFSREIFREEFKAIEDDVNRVTLQPDYFRKLKGKLWSMKNFFLAEVSGPAQEVLSIIQAQGWSAEDFSYGKNSGLLTFFGLYAYEKDLSRFKPPTERIKGYFTDAKNWPGKKSMFAKEISRMAGEKLVPSLVRILKVHEKHFAMALSAEIALKNMYVFGLIADIARKLKEYKDENNLMLLADAPKFLNGVIQDSDTPFIYEKVGSFYRNFLIDEFQDTSGMQWKNFQPLILNSLDQGYPGLVVGDVKQAIYRWRGGDLNLLQNQVVDLIGEQRTDVRELDRNFRSAAEVVNFNNAVFEQASKLISLETGAVISTEAYKDVHQKNAREEKGFVEIRFIEEPNKEEKQFNDEDSAGRSSRWTELAMEQLPLTFESLQRKGVRLKDIAILVRKNEEGQRIASHLLRYKNSAQAQPDCHYEVVSNESLRIDGAATVNLLLGAMRYLLNPDDSIARAQLGYEFARLHEPDRELPVVFAVSNQSIFETNLPESFTGQKAVLKKLSLIELTETLIEIFHLGKQQGELIYLQAFQDLVLEFYNRERNDLAAFIEWWEDNRHKKSVQISGDVDAAQIITIHKSKGLQFPYVIIPFCSWNLDHEMWQAPNIWVKSEEEAFKEAGYLPVKYSKTLEQSYFSADYREEHTKSYLDNLNLLYVAFTRAETGLIVTAPDPGVRNAKSTVAGLLYNAIQTSESLNGRWDSSANKWLSGEWIVCETVDDKQNNALRLEEYLSTSWREKLVIRHSGASYFQEEKDAAIESAKYGIHMHAVLSRLKYADELDSTIEDIVYEGLVTEKEKDSLATQLRELLSVPDVADWFSRDWVVETEVPILVPGSEASRLDRLVYRDKKAVVIDFKTGKRKQKDDGQVLEYVNTLREMNFTDVQGFLLYLTEKAVVEVKSGGRQKVVQKKKDKDQLSLGF